MSACARSGVALRQHFFACPSQELAFATGKTSKPALRNFLEEWIDFLSNELASAHGPQSFSFCATLMQNSLEEGCSAKSEQMGIKPTCGGAADKCAVSDHSRAIKNQQPDREQQRNLCDATHLQSDWNHKEEQRRNLELR